MVITNYLKLEKNKYVFFWKFLSKRKFAGFSSAGIAFSDWTSLEFA